MLEPLKLEGRPGEVEITPTDLGLRISVVELSFGYGSRDFYMTDEQAEQLFSYLNLYLLEKEQDDSAY